MSDDLAARLAFLLEVDRLKAVLRRTPLADGRRLENAAEHSWHAALAVHVLAAVADEPVDAARAALLLLVHDVVEIDAGDTFAYDVAGQSTQAAREEAAAERLFGLLPAADAAVVRAAWDEFEAGETPEARLAVAVDRTLPVLLNAASGGGSWRTAGVDGGRVRRRMEPIARASGALAAAVEARLVAAEEAGILRRAGAPPTTGAPAPLPVSTVRVARQTDRLAACERFYVDGVGLPVASRFAGHAGYDGLILGVPGHAFELELTSHAAGSPARAPGPDDLVVLYLDDDAAVDAAAARLVALGHGSVPPENPWWRVDVTVEDPDGFRVVLVRPRGA